MSKLIWNSWKQNFEKDNYTSDEVNVILDKYHSKVDKQFELLKKKLNYMSCDGALSPAYGDLLVGQKKGELMMLNKCKKLIEKAQRGELR